MSVAVGGSVSLNVAMTLQSTDALGAGTYNIPWSLVYAFQSGTGAGKASKVHSSERTVLSGATDNLDLSSTLTDGWGNVILFTKVKCFIIASKSTNTVNLTVGNGTTPVVGGPWGAAGANVLVMAPNDSFAFLSTSANGIFAVAAGTADILKIVAGAADSVYRIVVIGE